MSSNIRLYWWSEIYIQKKNQENYGDLLGKYLVEKITGKPVTWLRANKFYIKNLWRPVYVTIGSILEHIGDHCVVWGSGMSHQDGQIAGAKFTAVRGPLSRKRILELGYDCPEIYGDPALLLPKYYHPKVEKTVDLAIIPHINDYKKVRELFASIPSIAIIDLMTVDVERTTQIILSCKRVISSSLHGLIVPHAYGIPAIQVTFSDKIYGDGVKYHDYFLSVNLKPYEPMMVEQRLTMDYCKDLVDNHEQKLPKIADIQKLQEGLLKVCPFINQP